MRNILIASLVLCCLSACGVKGDLVHPSKIKPKKEPVAGQQQPTQ